MANEINKELIQKKLDLVIQKLMHLFVGSVRCV